MSTIAIIFISLCAGWIVNVVADTVPLRRPLRATWLLPLRALSKGWPANKDIIETADVDVTDAEPTDNAPGASAQRYRLTFVIAVILGLLAAVQTDQPVVMAVLALQAWFFLAIAIIDLEHRLVLNRMLLVGVPFVLLTNVLIGAPSLSSTLLGGAAGFGFFLFLALLAPGAMGMGDVKLAGFIGLITGFSGVMMALFLGILTGGIAGLVVLVRNRFRRGNTLAYAPYLVLGIWFFLFDVLEKVAYLIVFVAS